MWTFSRTVFFTPVFHKLEALYSFWKIWSTTNTFFAYK